MILSPKHGVDLFVALAFLCTACGCSSSEAGVTWTSDSPVISESAVLDWDTATILLPLDDYGMTPREIQIMDVAISVQLSQCITQTEEIPEALVDSAHQYLATSFVDDHWLYGRWDASYVAQHGWMGDTSSGLDVPGADSDAASSCSPETNNTDLTPIASGFVGDLASNKLTGASSKAYLQTLADHRFVDLQTQWQQCLTRAGYLINTDSETGGVHIDSTWGEDQIQQAFLTEAQCADNMSFTQQVADINAAYQLEFIRQNEAELLQIRNVADERVARATEILEEVGIL